VQVAGPVGAGDGGVANVRWGEQVFVVVQLVGHEEVNTGLFEGDTGVDRAAEFGLDAFLGGEDLVFHPFHRGRGFSLGPQPGRGLAHGGDFGFQVGLAGGGGDRQPGERGAGHDDRIPVAGGDLGHEVAAFVPS